MIKYQLVFQKMLSENEKEFNGFRKIHGLYEEDPKKWKKDFDEEGQKILAIIRRYENQLCGKSENCGYGSFSANLSSRFWGEIRRDFSKIDEVGVET